MGVARLMDGFAATVGEWAEDVKGAIEAIWRESIQAVEAEAQKPRGAGGRMRIKTGFLRASLMASTSMMPPISPTSKPVDGQTYAYTGQEVSAVINGAKLGQTIFMGYTAAYAAHREYGARGQPPDAFVRTAAQKWPQIVAAKEAELKGRLGLA